MTIQTSAPAISASPLSLHLVEEINHRVINEYTEAILSLSRVRDQIDSRAREALAEVVDRLTAHADAHRTLLPPSCHDVLNLGDYVGDLCAAFSRATLARSGVQLLLRTDEVWLDADRCWRIGLIITELVRNAARHGLRERYGAIFVHIVGREDGLSCLVCDSGHPCSEPRPGHGQRVVTALAAELGGSVNWCFTQRGTLVRLQIPRLD